MEPGGPCVDVPVGDDLRRLEVAAGAERERQPRVLGLGPGRAGWPTRPAGRRRSRSRRWSGRFRRGRRPHSASSQTCSGSRPWPEVMLRIAVRSAPAPSGSPAATSYSPRSPASTGHRCPEPTLPEPFGPAPGRRWATACPRSCSWSSRARSSRRSRPRIRRRWFRSGRSRRRWASDLDRRVDDRSARPGRPGRSPGSTPRRTSSRKPASTIDRWSAVMLPLPRL